MRFFLVKRKNGRTKSNVVGIEGDTDKFMQTAKEKCEKVVELEEKQVVVS